MANIRRMANALRQTKKENDLLKDLLFRAVNELGFTDLDEWINKGEEEE
jgi:hypothetical protein